MLLHSIVFASRCARVQAEFLAAEAEDEAPQVRFIPQPKRPKPKADKKGDKPVKAKKPKPGGGIVTKAARLKNRDTLH